MEWLILLILIAVLAGGYYAVQRPDEPETAIVAPAAKPRGRMDAIRTWLRPGEPRGTAEQFVARVAGLPQVNGAFKAWLESLDPAESKALVQGAVGLGPRPGLKTEIAWLLDGQIDDHVDLKQRVEESVLCYCQACWKATRVRDAMAVFTAFLDWQDAPDEDKQFSQRMFDKLVETGSISVPPTIYLYPWQERRERELRPSAKTTSLRVSRETAPSSGRRVGAAALSTVERVIFFKEVPLFEGLTFEQLQILAKVSEEYAYDEGTVVFAEQDVGDALYIVVSGCVSIEQTGKQEGEVVFVGTRSSRQYFGELAIFDEEPRSASVIAIEPTLLLSLHRAPLVALIREDSDLALELIRVLSLRLREAHRQVADQAASHPRGTASQ